MQEVADPARQEKRRGMSKRKYVLAASLGVVGALLMSGTASAAVTGISYTASVSPKKQSNKTFGPASISNNIETFYTGGFLPTATETAIVFSTDLKFTPGNVARCQLSQINTAPEAQANAACGASRIGQGSAIINGGVLTGKVVAYNGTPSGGSPSVYLHVDVFTSSGGYAFSTTLTGVLNLHTNTLTVMIPPTGTSITHFDTTINKVKSGKKKGKATYYVMARCHKKWVNSAVTRFSDGSTRGSQSVQKCKPKK
jgi:hypothetical protein